MGRFIGGRFGSIVPISPGTDAPSAVYSIYDQYYSKRDGGWYEESGLTATGGVVSDYTTAPGDVYRAHIFTTTGKFAVTEIGDFGSNVEYLVVAGGGGGGTHGGGNAGGGGGAGGLRTNLPGVQNVAGSPLTGAAFPISTSPGEYTVTVGGGGAGSIANDGTYATNGSDSYFGPPNPPDGITSSGGGHGGGSNSGGGLAETGGSGGAAGASGPNVAGLAGNSGGYTIPEGNAGGAGDNGNPYTGGGGGGAGENG